MDEKIIELLEFVDGLEEEFLSNSGNLERIEKAVRSIRTLINFYVKNIRKYADKLRNEEF